MKKGKPTIEQLVREINSYPSNKYYFIHRPSGFPFYARTTVVTYNKGEEVVRDRKYIKGLIESAPHLSLEVVSKARPFYCLARTNDPKTVRPLLERHLDKMMELII